MLKATKEKQQNYCKEGIRLLFQDGENFDNFCINVLLIYY